MRREVRWGRRFGFGVILLCLAVPFVPFSSGGVVHSPSAAPEVSRPNLSHPLPKEFPVRGPSASLPDSPQALAECTPLPCLNGTYYLSNGTTSPHNDQSQHGPGIFDAEVYDPATGWLFVANSTANGLYIHWTNVSILNSFDLALISQVFIVGEVTAMVYVPGEGVLAATSNCTSTGSCTGFLSLISDSGASVGTVVTTLELGADVSVTAMAYDAEQQEVFAVNSALYNDSLVVVTADDQLVTQLLVNYPWLNGLAFDPQTDIVCVSEYDSAGSNVTMVSASTDAVLGVAGVGDYTTYGPGDLVYDPSNGQVIAVESATGNHTDWVQTINTTTDSVTGTGNAFTSYAVPAGEGGLVEGSYLYVVARAPSGDLINVVSLSNLSRADAISVGDNPTSVAPIPPMAAVAVGNLDGDDLSIVAISALSGVRITSFGAQPLVAPPNHTFWLNVSATGGAPPYKYTYTGLPTGCTSSNTSDLPCSATSTGTYLVEVNVTGSSGGSATAWTLVQIRIVPLRILTFTSSMPSSHPDQTVWFNATISGGWAPYAFRYSGLPTGCTSANVSSLVCTPTGNGNFTVVLNVTDSLGQGIDASFVQRVTNIPVTISSFEPSSTSVDAFTTLWFNVSASEGSEPLTYAYAALPPGCTSTNSSTLQCTPTASGSYNATVTVSGPFGQSSNATSPTVVVNQYLEGLFLAPGPTVSLAFGGSQVFDGSGTNLTGAGISNLTFTWTITPAFLGLLNATHGSSVTLTAQSTPGSGTLFVNSTFYGVSRSARDQIHVSETKGPSITSFSAVPSTVQVGMTTNITTSASGDGLTYAYGGLPPGCTSASVPTLPCSPTEAGSYNVDVNVTDSNGLTVEANTTLTVTPPSASEELAAVAVSPAGPVTLNTASPDLFTATPENGTGHPLSVVVAYHWSFSPSTLGTLNSTSGRIVQFTSGGTAESGTLWVNVTFAGVTKSASVTITVESKTTGSGTEGPTYFGLSEFDFVSLIVAIMAVVVGIIPVILELRKRENRREARREEERREGASKDKVGTASEATPPTSLGSSAPGTGATLSKPVSEAPIQAPDSDLAFVMGGPTVPSSPTPMPPPPPPEGAMDGPAPGPSPQTPVPTPATKACIMCGKQIPERARFCRFCNEPQD